MEKQITLEEKFLKTAEIFNKQIEIKNEECQKAKKFIALVLEKLQRTQYMELAFINCSQNREYVIIGKGWVGTKTSDGELTFELAADLNPCMGRKEYSAKTILAAIASPDRAEIQINEIRRHLFNSSYFKNVDAFLSPK